MKKSIKLNHFYTNRKTGERILVVQGTGVVGQYLCWTRDAQEPEHIMSRDITGPECAATEEV